MNTLVWIKEHYILHTFWWELMHFCEGTTPRPTLRTSIWFLILFDWFFFHFSFVCSTPLCMRNFCTGVATLVHPHLEAHDCWKKSSSITRPHYSSNPGLSNKALLSSQISSRISCLFLPRLGSEVRCHTYLAFASISADPMSHLHAFLASALTSEPSS